MKSFEHQQEELRQIRQQALTGAEATSPGPGHNLPDWSAEESARLAREHERLERDVTNLLAEARQAPPSVENEQTAELYTNLIKRLRDQDNKVEALRESEKAPHLHKARAVDSFFFRIRERIQRRVSSSATPGAVDVLMARLQDYNARRLAEEQRRRDEAARVAREEAARAARAREDAERQRREAEAKAARARNAERVEQLRREADEREAREAEARAAEQQARQKAQEAEADANAKPADMIRERHDSGAINTMKQYWHVEITNSEALDRDSLWPFIKQDALLDAVKMWAKVTQYRRSMQGAVIEKRSRTEVK
jgi:hypothetical protein